MNEEYPEKFNQIDFYCPICGKLARANELKHHCSKKILNSLDSPDIEISLDFNSEEENIEEMFTYADILMNFQEWDCDENEDIGKRYKY
jgi:hypothetical protein